MVKKVSQILKPASALSLLTAVILSGCGIQDNPLGSSSGDPTAAQVTIAGEDFVPLVLSDSASDPVLTKKNKKDKKKRKDKKKKNRDKNKGDSSSDTGADTNSAITDLAEGKGEGITVGELISAEQGGQVDLDWESKDANGVTGSKIKCNIKIMPHALEQDTYISVTLTNPSYAMIDVDMEFGAHGTKFLVPAEVKLDMENLDLKGIDPASIDFYWYDADNDRWVQVPSLYKDIDIKQGKIQGIWLFDHFSRYSLGGDSTFLIQKYMYMGGIVHMY